MISLLGGMTHSRAINPSAVARRIADAVGAECFQLTAPVFVASEATRNALWAEPGLTELLERARRVDLAVVSVGDVSEDSTLFREGLLPPLAAREPDRGRRRRRSAVPLPRCDGNVVDHPVSRRVVSVGLDDLRRVPKIVIAAGGRHKVDAIRAALKATRAACADHRRVRGARSSARLRGNQALCARARGVALRRRARHDDKRNTTTRRWGSTPSTASAGRSPPFPPGGGCYPLDELTLAVSGAAGTAAIAAAKMGLKTLAVGGVGDDLMGDWVLERLRHFGVDTSSDAAREGMEDVLVDRHDAGRWIAPGAAHGGRHRQLLRHRSDVCRRSSTPRCSTPAASA